MAKQYTFQKRNYVTGIFGVIFFILATPFAISLLTSFDWMIFLLVILLYPISIYLSFGLIQKKIIITKDFCEYYVANRLKKHVAWNEVSKVMFGNEITWTEPVPMTDRNITIFTRDSKLSVNGNIHFSNSQIQKMFKLVKKLKKEYYPHIIIEDKGKSFNL